MAREEEGASSIRSWFIVDVIDFAVMGNPMIITLILCVKVQLNYI